MQEPLTYKSAGVDIDAGDELIRKIAPAAKKTARSGAMGALGGFGGLFDLKAAGFIDPILVAGTDGVGTKLQIAIATENYAGIGIDLVAMCANDVLAQGAAPLFFLDYYATGKLDVNAAAQVIESIARGCEQAGCALIGGETAEMPGFYPDKHFDLAGFCVGAAERGKLLPRESDLKVGDVLIALPSSGLHANGFSLARKIAERSGVKYHDPCPVNPAQSFGEMLLTPTEIYVKRLAAPLRQQKILAFAHITGGGLTENLPRILPEYLSARVNLNAVALPELFAYLQKTGGVTREEMLRVFNCGVGGVIVASPEDADAILAEIHAADPEKSPPFICGELVTGTKKTEYVGNFA